jgi:hypothetical protein
MHINVKPMDRNQVHETAEQAIHHVIAHGLHAQRHWQDVHFGRDLRDIRRVSDAIKAKDKSAFTAHKRRGYWRVELAR